MVAKIFPKDKTKIESFFKLNKRHHWFYKNKEGEEIFVLYRVENLKSDQIGRKKVVHAGSFNGNKPQTKLGWDNDPHWERPIYKLDQLLASDKDVLIVLGNNTADKAQKYFPNYFVTTFYGGSINWRKTDWSPLKDRRVIFLPDIERETRKAVLQFEHLAHYVDTEFNCKAEVVRVPEYADIVRNFENNSMSYSYKNWDLADALWPGLDLNKDIIENTYIVEEQHLTEIPDYISIVDDRINDRYIYLTSGDQFFDTFKKSFYKPATLDNLYQRDTTLTTSKPKLEASKWLHRSNVKYVDLITFSVGMPPTFEKNGTKYLNRYEPPKLQEINYKDYDISIFRNHIKDTICDGDLEAFNVIEDTIAWDLRNVKGNRKWMICLASEEGLGKDLFFKALKKLYGEKNCEDLMLDDLVERFRPWFVEACYLFLGEVDDQVVRNKKLKGSIKKIIADEDFRIEAYKGVDSIKVKTFFTIWGSSNESIPIRTGKNQRRYYIVDSAVLPVDILAKDPKYYDKLGKFVEDESKLREVYNYYKKHHKISEQFTEHRCPRSENLHEIIEASQAEFIRYIDRLYRERPHEIDSFKFDLVNVRKLAEELQEYSLEDDAWGGKNLKLDYNKVLRWVKRRPNKPVKNQAHTLPGKERREGRLWVIKNHSHWDTYIKQGGTHLDTSIDAHFEGLLNFDFQDKLKEKERKVNNG